jgi:hypothetical protein
MSSKSNHFEGYPLHTQMMMYFFLASNDDNDAEFNKGLDILKSGNIDVFNEDNQIFRELSVGRWMAPKCRALCNEIMKLTNMSMEDIRNHIDKVYNRPPNSWSENHWNEYDNCDCEGICMKSHSKQEK